MAANNYKGWRVPENIIIVAKECRVWDRILGRYTSVSHYQGYVVDPGNKDQLETAMRWAEWTESIGKYDYETHKYEDQIEHVGEVHEFKNEGFTLTLLESADGSSQGGKLSFWNCKIAKDDKEFIIGIASDYLLEILLHNDFKNGVCQSTLSFARCKGGVGMMNKSMPSYQQFLQDEELRTSMKKGKTKKREPGHLYSTLTGGDVHFSTFYKWYEPVYEQKGYLYGRTLIGFKRLAEPETAYWEPWYDDRYTKKSEYFERSFYLSKSIPARIDSGKVVEIDITDDELLNKHIEAIIGKVLEQNWQFSTFDNSIGLSTSKDAYELPENLREAIIKRGLKLWE